LTGNRKQATCKYGPVDRLKFALGSWLGYWIMRFVGCTLRYEVQGWENHRAIVAAGKKIIYTFWHGRIFAGTYFFRNRGIVVMTSENRDGEYIARVIRRFGYGAARGSSSRGGGRALVEMIRELGKGHDVAFSIDGPRGPRYVAKNGAVWIAAKTGSAVFPFHFSAEKKWTLNSWDRFEIPKPFSRVLCIMAPPIYVPPEATEARMEESQQLLQRTLRELLELCDGHWGRRETT